MSTLASAFGIRSLAAAAVFAALYAPLLVFFLSRTVARPVYVYIILTFFCAVRVTAFVLRAVLSRDAAAANDVHLLIAYEIVYNIGFFGLLYSAYTLATNRVALARDPPQDPVSRLLRKRILFRVALMAAVAVGITGVVQSTSGSTAAAVSTGNSLRKASLYIFLVCTILVVLQTLLLARAELSDGGYHPRSGPPYGIFVLLLIVLLLLAREVFFAATFNSRKQNNEPFWYPLAAVTELIAVVLFAAPGLVPDPSKEL